MKNKNILFLSLIISVALHLTFVITISLLQKLNTYSSSSKKETIIVDLKNAKELKKISGQIVSQDEKSANEKEPEKADYLSGKNNKVEKQTVAKNKGEFKNVQQQSKGQNTDLNHGANSSAKPLQVKNLFPSYHEDGIYKKMLENQQSGGGGQQSQTDDHIKGVAEGYQTMLNAKEFRYYTYYNRIRRQLSQFWEPKVKEKMTYLIRSGRNIASSQERTTKLLIVLNSSGTLIKVQVLGDSGIQDLDDAAIEAFRAAAPFPNPPKGIVENDGTVKIRWDFILES